MTVVDLVVVVVVRLVVVVLVLLVLVRVVQRVRVVVVVGIVLVVLSVTVTVLVLVVVVVVPACWGFTYLGTAAGAGGDARGGGGPATTSDGGKLSVKLPSPMYLTEVRGTFLHVPVFRSKETRRKFSSERSWTGSSRSLRSVTFRWFTFPSENCWSRSSTSMIRRREAM